MEYLNCLVSESSSEVTSEPLCDVISIFNRKIRGED